MTTFTPVVLLPESGIDVDGRNDLAGVMHDWLRPIEDWYERQARLTQNSRLVVHLRDIQLEREAIDLSLDNPHATVLNALQERGYPFGPDEMTLVYLAGWNNAVFGGWGGFGLGLVGDFFYRMAKAPSGFQVGIWGAAHEMAHCLVSLRHQDSSLSPPDVLRPYPGELASSILRPELATLQAADQVLVGCPVSLKVAPMDTLYG